MGDRIRVLHVDDDPDLADITALFLERGDPRITVETVSNATEGLERLDDLDLDANVDCIVSDHDMPGPNGIEFLEAVRERDPDLPLLYTGKGSESVASEAYHLRGRDGLPQKGGGTEQYEILANRIVDAAEKRRIEREADRTQAHLRAITDHSMDAIPHHRRRQPNSVREPGRRAAVRLRARGGRRRAAGNADAGAEARGAP